MPLLAVAAIFVSQTPVTLLYQPKVGTTYKTSMVMKQSGMTGDTTVSNTITTKVLAFEEGFYKLESLAKSDPAKGETGSISSEDNKPSIVYVDKHYKVKPEPKGTANNVQKMLGGMTAAFSSGLYPEKPISIGDKWTNTIDFGALMGAMIQTQNGEEGPKTKGKINVNFKFVKADETAISIDSTIDGTVEMEMGAGAAEGMKIPMKFSGTGTSSTDPATGITIASDTKIKMEMEVGGQTVDFNMEIILKRL